MIRIEDFAFPVDLPNPHNGIEVREWINASGMRYVYNLRVVTGQGYCVTYTFTKQEDAVFFALRWA